MSHLTQSCSALPGASQLAKHLRARAPQHAGMFAVRLEVLRNRWENQQPWPAAVLHEPLWAISEGTDVGLYTLADADLVLLCSNLVVDRVDEAISRITRMVGDDLSTCAVNAPTLRVTWYDLDRNNDCDSLLAAVDASADADERRHLPQPLRPIVIADLPPMGDCMRRLPLARMIRRQQVLRLASAASPSLLFQEFYVSIDEFQRVFAPGVDITAHPALFGYLSQCFDQEILAHLVAKESSDLTRQGFSININITTMPSANYNRFEEVFAGRNDIFLEFQLTDILANFAIYIEVRDRVKQKGFRVVVDGVTFSTLSHLDLTGFEADFIKLLCPGSGRLASADAAIEHNIRRLGADRLICARLEDEELMTWALGIGVSHFQGRLIDTLIAALTAQGVFKPAANS